MDIESQAMLSWLRTQHYFDSYTQLLNGKFLYSILRKVQCFPECNLRDGSAKAIYVCNLNSLCDSINRYKNTKINFNVVGLINNSQLLTLKQILQQTLCICVHCSNNTQFVKAIMGLPEQTQQLLKEIITRKQQPLEQNLQQQVSVNVNLLTKIDELSDLNSVLSNRINKLQQQNSELKDLLLIKDQQLANWHSSNNLLISKENQLILKLRDQILQLSRQKESLQFQNLSLLQKNNYNQQMLQAKSRQIQQLRQREWPSKEMQSQQRCKQLRRLLVSSTNLSLQLKQKNSKLQSQLHDNKILTQKFQIQIAHLKKLNLNLKEQLSNLMQLRSPPPLKFQSPHTSFTYQMSSQLQQLNSKLVQVQNQLEQEKKGQRRTQQENENLRITLKQVKRRLKQVLKDKEKLQQNIVMMRTERGQQNQILVSTLISLSCRSDKNKCI